MRKKVTALFMAAVLAIGAAGCSSKPADTPTTAAPDSQTQAQTQGQQTEAPKQTDAAKPSGDVKNQIIMSNTTDTTGDIREYWSNTSTDARVNELVTGYRTVEYDQGAQYAVNETAIKEYEITENEDGSKTFTFTLQDNLLWSNGEKITAKDYVCTPLLFGSSLIAEMGVTSFQGEKLVGFEEYNSGDTNIFKGVRLLGDDKFAFIMSSEFLPNFFEIGLMRFKPEYLKGWLPEDVDIADDGEGAYFTGEFTNDHCGESIENWRWHMDVFSGPYVRTAYDESNRQYTMKINDKFIGNFEGQKPSVETVILKTIKADTQMDELRTGSVDLLMEVNNGSDITAGLDLVDQDAVKQLTYDRNGYGYIGFNCKIGPTQFIEVRHAIAYLLDRVEFAKTFTGGFGSVVNGPYGTGMWMAQDGEDELAELNSYAYSYDNAVAALEAGGWTLDANGGAYSGNGVRYKKLDDGTLMPLIINWASSENNSVSDLIATKLAKSPDAAKAGIEINQVVMTFDEMYTSHFLNPDEDFYNMFNLATNFSAIYDMKASYEIGHPYNSFKTQDEELQKLASDMLKVESDDPDKFLELWLAFIKRWNEYLPALPLYSNQYFDFYNNKIDNMDGITGYWSVSDQMPYATVSGY